MSGGYGRQSSRDVASEAEDTRAHLASTLELLRTNLRPENVVDEVMSNAKAGAASVADSLAGVAKANPLPSLLIAAGAFVVMGVMSRGAPSRPKTTPAPEGLPRAALLPDAGDHVEAAPRLDPSAPRIVDDGDNHASHARVASGIDRLKRSAASAYDAAASGTRDAVQGLSHYVPRDQREVKSKLSNLLDNQPLILGAIGLAVGAAIGAALPITETEDHLMGGSSNQVRQAAADVARQEVEGLRAVAGEAVDNIKRTATDHEASAAAS